MRPPLTFNLLAPARCHVVGPGFNPTELLAMVKDYPAPDSKHRLLELAEHPRGQAATTVTACARLEWRARYVGRFRSDVRGQRIHSKLATEGIDLWMCETVDAPQAVPLILVVTSGRRTVLSQRAAALNLTADYVECTISVVGRVLISTTIKPRLRRRRRCAPSYRRAHRRRRGKGSIRV